LATEGGRLEMVCVLINCYRLLTRMATALPPLEQRIPFWDPIVRGSIVVTLNPTGAAKSIPNFKAFVRDADNAMATLQNAYSAAARAAQQRKRDSQQPFLVTAAEGPAVSKGTYSVQTTPLGYTSTPQTESVRNQG
jgi:hypothetical protein